MAGGKRGRSNTLDAASGVEALIERLRNEGVASGQAQAEQIIQNAKSQAETIIRQAQAESAQIVQQARAEASNLEQAGRQALEVAGRDMILSFKNRLLERFTQEVKHLVGEETQRLELLQRVILEVAGKAREQIADAEQVEILLPEKVAGWEELSRDPEELQHGTLTQFTRLLSREMLRRGVTFAPANDIQGGIKLQLKDEGIVFDLSDRAIADVLLQHLQPRFRSLLEGIVK
jgi:V/A-type H+-transporting ATPase subunit E